MYTTHRLITRSCIAYTTRSFAVKKAGSRPPVVYYGGGKLPLDTAGTICLPAIPQREFVADFFAEKHISDDLLCEHFLGMLATFLQGIAMGDKQAVTKIAEHNLATKVLTQEDTPSIKYEAPGDEAIDNVYIIDRLFLKGVNITRALNETNLDYVQSRKLEKEGIREYIHKYHLGLQPFYYKKKFEQEMRVLQAQELDDESADNYYMRMQSLKRGMHEQRQLMNANQFQILLRVTMQLTKGAIGTITATPDGSPQSDEFSLDYTGNHIAVFECDLKVPPALSLMDHSYKEYILAHRLNFKNWRLVDLDNYMQGNPHFDTFASQSEWQQNVDTVMGTYDGLKQPSKNAQDVKKLLPIFEKYQNYIKQAEPTSSEKMPNQKPKASGKDWKQIELETLLKNKKSQDKARK